MLRMVIIFMLCFGAGRAMAQDNDDQTNQSEDQKRRPSWSSGLPERQKPEAISRPNLSSDFKDELTLDRSELGLERPKVNLPEPVIDRQPVAEQEPVSETIDSSAEVPVTDSEELPVVEQPVVMEPEPVAEPEPEPEPEPVIYEWQVIKQAEVDFPSRGVRNQINGWVDVEVTLNPQGDVVSAQTVDYSAEAGIYVESAEESLRQWVFQPPQEQGVNELVSKVYRIDFVPPEIEQPVSTQTTAVQDLTTPESSVEGSISGQQNSNYHWQVLNQVPLEYPMAAARKRQEGWVDIMVTVNPEGDVVNLEVERYSSRGRGFVEPAKNTLQQWQFAPPKEQGINVNVSRSYRIEFKL